MDFVYPYNQLVSWNALYSGEECQKERNESFGLFKFLRLWKVINIWSYRINGEKRKKTHSTNGPNFIVNGGEMERRKKWGKMRKNGEIKANHAKNCRFWKLIMSWQSMDTAINADDADFLPINFALSRPSHPLPQSMRTVKWI